MQTIVFRRRASPRSGVVLALLFAMACVFTQTFQLWFPSLRARVDQPLSVTVRAPSPYSPIAMLRDQGVYGSYLAVAEARCPRVFGRGSTVAEPPCQELIARMEDALRWPSFWQLLGLFSVYWGVGIWFAALMRREWGRSRLLRVQTDVFLLLGALAAGVKAWLLLTDAPALAAPVALVALLTAPFVGRRVSLSAGMYGALLVASLVDFDLEVLLAQAASVLAATAILKPAKPARRPFKTALVVAAAVIGASIVLRFALSGWGQPAPVSAFLRVSSNAPWLMALLNGLLSGLGAWLLTPLFKYLLGAVSSGRLFELQDLDHPLLKLLQERTPGTWAHTRVAADLAETITNAIGADANLARVGAYFHDVGKTAHPELFVENQFGGPNPHDAMAPEQSVSAIVDHVIEGVRILRQAGMPEDIVEFAYSHHGTSLAEYFWHKQLKSGNAANASEAAFRYPGLQPQTRETAILMLADAVEAASRTVEPPEEAGFRAMVGQVVFSKLRQGQLDESGLSVGDLHVAFDAMVRFLVNLHHGRVKYPPEAPAKNAANEAPRPAEKAD